MTWDIAPECVSAVVLVIVWIYSRKGSVLPTLKNRLFQGCFLVTFLAMSTNILSTFMLMQGTFFPRWLLYAVLTVYYILTPLMGMVYFLYAASVIYVRGPRMQAILRCACIPGILYGILALLNLFTKSLFYLDGDGNYVRGSLVVVTYLIFYLYCIASMVLVLVNRRRVEKSTYRILASFPVIATVVIVIQQLYPRVILSGSAATLALLILYLHLQNRQLSLDPLTSVPNRSELLSMMDLLMLAKPMQPFVVLVISLRDFKRVNNQYSQWVGDAFLKDICRYLCSLVPHGSVYRFGGDEFAVLLDQEDKAFMQRFIGDLKARMAQPWHAGEFASVIPLAIGVAHYPTSARSSGSLISAVEYAVAQAKCCAPGAVCFCDKQMMAALTRKEQVLRILKEKLREDSFELYYQPIIVLKTGRFQYAESLMRISDPTLGPISPAEFIPLAEESGLIVPLTYRILDKVCRFVNRLLADGIDIKSVHVNFSSLQFNEIDLEKKVLEIIRRNGTPPSAIKIEVTESTVAGNTQAVTDFALAMRARGILMGLDDFGTGYSNISSVMKISFATLKLDKSLLWTAMKSDKSASIVKHLTHAFQDLDMSVVAEGVENEAQNRFVQEAGIDQVQGFYYAKPMPEAEAIDFLKGCADGMDGGATNAKTGS